MAISLERAVDSGVASVDLAVRTGSRPPYFFVSFSLAGSVARVASRPWLYINAVLTAHPDINAVRR